VARFSEGSDLVEIAGTALAYVGSITCDVIIIYKLKIDVRQVAAALELSYISVVDSIMLKAILRENPDDEIASRQSSRSDPEFESVIDCGSAVMCCASRDRAGSPLG